MFPLRYKDELCNSFLDEGFLPLPGDDEPEEWHEWDLKMSKTIRLFTRYFWNGISEKTKIRTKILIGFYIRTIFEKFYVYGEGAFSNYPKGKHAVLDGISMYSIFKDIGALSSEKQIKYWGDPEKTISNLGEHAVADLKDSDLKLILNFKNINSLRIYQTDPDFSNLTTGVSAIVYPGKKSVLDIMDLTPRMKNWLKTTEQSMGNWVSKDTVIKEMDSIKIDEVPAYESGISIETANNLLKKNAALTIIGFDILQIPICEIKYVSTNK
jgi:hypothetical protein